jgi:carboxylate-amine ligase
LKRGTSSHRQIATYDEVVAAGALPDEALKTVVDMLVAETVTGF